MRKPGLLWGLWVLVAALCLPAPAGAQGGFAGLAGLSGVLTGKPIQTGPIQSASVVMAGHRLFAVYSAETETANDRAALANLTLDDALRQSHGDIPPRLSVKDDSSGTEVQIDGKHLLAVTDADSASYGLPPAQVAALWIADINSGFDQAMRERRPAYLRQAAKQAGVLFLIGVAITLAIWLVAHRYFEKPGWAVQVLVWAILIRRILYLFPQTRPFDLTLAAGVLRPLSIGIITAISCAAIARLWAAVLRRMFPPIPRDLPAGLRTERTFQRRATLGAVIRVTGVTVIWFAGVIVALTWMGVNLSALLASAGLIGVAVGLATQSSMKDFVAGISIVSDDRYGVGDSIETGGYQGTVERITLRITQIRDMSGRLITIPNGNIADVANMTSRWAQVDFKVGVSYYDDLAKAMDVLRDAAQKLADEWPERILAPPQMLGVDFYGDNNITLRLTMRTAPGDQWTVARELRLRAKTALDEAGIFMLNALHPAAPAPVVAAPTPAAAVNGTSLPTTEETRAPELAANEDRTPTQPAADTKPA